MFTFWGIIVSLTMFGGLPAVGGLWMFERTRARRRNRRGQCATCGTSWASTASGGPFLIHGRLVCSDCGERARRRMPWHFGILAAAAAFAASFIVATEGLAAMILLPVGSTIAMTIGVVQLMKFWNRNAQRRIAAGEFPDFEALGAGTSTEPQRSLPEGSAV